MPLRCSYSVESCAMVVAAAETAVRACNNIPAAIYEPRIKIKLLSDDGYASRRLANQTIQFQRYHFNAGFFGLRESGSVRDARKALCEYPPSRLR